MLKLSLYGAAVVAAIMLFLQDIPSPVWRTHNLSNEQVSKLYIEKYSYSTSHTGRLNRNMTHQLMMMIMMMMIDCNDCNRG